MIAKYDTTGRIIGSFLIVSAYFIVLHVSATVGAAMHLLANIISIPFLIVTAYFVVLHVSATIGALMHLVANVISLPFFIRTKAHDVVIMLSFLMVISLTKLL